MAFNISPPQNITNLFGICLAREEIKKKHKFKPVFSLYFGPFGMFKMTISL
jgi:hypothetical protein